MNNYKFYIYFSDSRKLIESNNFKQLFNQFITIVKNEKTSTYISFGINKGMESCDLAYSEYIKNDNKCHIVFSNDNLKSKTFNNNLVNVNIKNIMINMI